MQTTNYYDILQVSPQASNADLKAAYRRLALQHHPDKTSSSPNPNTPKGKEFEIIQEAYTVLSNPDKRRIYDKYGQTGLSLHSQLGEKNPKAVDFFLDTRKVIFASLFICILSVCTWISVFLGVRKLYGLNDYTWGILFLPIWIGFSTFIVAGVGLAWYMNIRLDLSQLHAEEDQPETEDKWTAFFAISMAIILFSLPTLVEIAMVIIGLDYPGVRWPLIGFILCEAGCKGVHLWASEDKRILQMFFASTGALCRILAFAWFLYHRSLSSLWFILLDFLFLIGKIILLTSLKSTQKLMKLERHDLIKLVFFLVFLTPILLPFSIRTAASLSFSLHWCLVPLHILLLVACIVFGLVIPLLVHQMGDEKGDMEKQQSSLGAIRQLIHFYAFAPVNFVLSTITISNNKNKNKHETE